MINKMHIEMMPWQGFEFGDPIAEMITRIVAFLRIVFTLVKTQLSGLSLALEAKTLGRVAGRTQTRENTVRLDSFGYNPRSELTSANLGTDSFVYSFDNIGNRINATEKNISTNYTTNNLNQYQGQQFAYDFDGNQTTITTSAGTFAVEYNGENRPIKFTNLADSTYIRMRYDYMGRRAVKLCYNANGQWLSTAKFFYKDYTLIEESNASNIVQKEFVWDPTAGAATRPLYMRAPQKGTNLIYFHDANKNVSELHFLHIPNGIAAHYEYDAFGNVTKSTRNTTVTGTDYRTFNPFQFSSEYFDSELGLVYYNYRHYNPTSGRFLSRDPIEEIEGNTNDIKIDIYLILKNNCITHTDYLGLEENCPEGEIWTEKPNPIIPEPDGCSVPTLIQNVLLDYFYEKDEPVKGASFKQACNNHDLAYSKCGKTNVINDSYTKAKADNDFLVDMQNACDFAYANHKFKKPNPAIITWTTDISHRKCLLASNLYYAAVVSLVAFPNYVARQRKACCCKKEEKL